MKGALYKIWMGVADLMRKENIICVDRSTRRYSIINKSYAERDVSQRRYFYAVNRVSYI